MKERDDNADWDTRLARLRELCAGGAPKTTMAAVLGVSINAVKKAIFRHCRDITPVHRWQRCELQGVLANANTEDEFIRAMANRGIAEDIARTIHDVERRQAPEIDDDDEGDYRPRILRSFDAVFRRAEAEAGRRLSY